MRALLVFVPPCCSSLASGEGQAKIDNVRPASPKAMQGSTRTSLFFAVLVSVLVIAAAARSETLDSIFESGNNAFWNGEYEKAVSQYERLEDLGVQSLSLSYNIGTAYARLGQLGTAVYHYERALKIDPGHDDTKSNLAVIRDYLARRASKEGRDADLAPAVGPWRAILDRFSTRGAAFGFLFFHLSLFAVLVIRRFIAREMPRLSLGVLTGVLAIMTTVTFAVALGKWHQDNFLKEAVVLTAGVLEVKEGPASEITRFAIEEGSRVTIAEEKNNWIRFRDSEGRDGWAPAEQLGKI